MKGRRPWHKRYHEDALNGYMGLTLEERGVYSTCLDLIYMRGAPLLFDTAAEQQWVAGWLGCSTRLARSIIGALIGKANSAWTTAPSSTIALCENSGLRNSSVRLALRPVMPG